MAATAYGESMELVNRLVPDNREAASLIWLAIVLIWVLSRTRLRASVCTVVHSALHLKILVPLAVMLAYVLGEVWIGAKLSLWTGGLAKSTLLWMLMSAATMLIGFDKASKDPHFYRHSVLSVIGIAVFIEFFMNLYVLSLPGELVLQPVMALLAMMSVVAARDERHHGVKRLIDMLIAIIGFALFGYTVQQLYLDWHEIDTRALMRQFALPIWLTTGFLPFIYCLSLYAYYEMAFAGINWATTERKRRWRAKSALFTKYHFKAREIYGLPWSLMTRIAAAPTFGAAREIIEAFQQARRA